MSKRGRPFEPGNTYSHGRPPGSRNKTTQRAREILESHAESIVRKGILLALNGETKVLVPLLGSVLGPNRPAAAKINGLKFRTIEDIDRSSHEVMKKAADGELTSTDAQQFLALIETRRKALETRDFELRLRELESMSREILPASIG